MIRYLVKNNLKIMGRSMTNILLFVIAPLTVIAVLSSAFSALMESYQGLDGFRVGYRAAESGMSQTVVVGLKTVTSAQNITLVEYDEGDPKQLVRDDDLGGFVVLEGDNYTVYVNEDKGTEAQMLTYTLHAFFENMGTPSGATAETGERIQTVTTDYMPAIDSTDYYGIIEINYFGWCAVICSAGLFISEKKYKIGKKLRVTRLNELQLYLAKFLPSVLVVCCGVGLAALFCTLIFGVHFGNLLWTSLIVIMSVMAAVAFGLMIYAFFDSMIITVILVFAIVWIWGFLGGSFETYMYSGFSQSVQEFSPLYHINRCLVELSCMGKSDYIGSALIYSGSMCVGCSAMAVLAGVLRRRGRA